LKISKLTKTVIELIQLHNIFMTALHF